jgi:hypothetical protein
LHFLILAPSAQAYRGEGCKALWLAPQPPIAASREVAVHPVGRHGTMLNVPKGGTMIDPLIMFWRRQDGCGRRLIKGAA